MMLAAFATSPPGNLRAATNEAWLWISAAAVFTSRKALLLNRDRHNPPVGCLGRRLRDGA